jgi:hypothetical protein
MRSPQWLVLVLAPLLLAGCSLTLDSRNLGVPVTMASPATAPAQGQHFEITGRALYGLFGLIQIKQPSLQRVLAGQLVGGKAVRDVRIRVHSSPGDVLLTVLTAGLVSSRAVTFEGTVSDQPAP